VRRWSELDLVADGIEAVAIPIVSVPPAPAVSKWLASKEFLGLAGRHAAIMFVRESGRTPADAITDWPVQAVGRAMVLITEAKCVVVPMAVARPSGSRSCDCQRHSARDEKCLSHRVYFVAIMNLMFVDMDGYPPSRGYFRWEQTD